MRQLVTLAVVAAILYFGYTRGLPWLKEQLRSDDEAAAGVDEAWRCVGLAEEARDIVSDQLRQFARPPVDPGAWATAMLHTGSRLAEADSACSCREPACRPAGQALREMRQLVNQFDRAVRGDGSGFGNPATYQEEIDRLLDAARALLP